MIRSNRGRNRTAAQSGCPKLAPDKRRTTTAAVLAVCTAVVFFFMECTGPDGYLCIPAGSLQTGSTVYAKSSEELKRKQKALEKEQQQLQQQQQAIQGEKSRSERGLQNANQNISELTGEQEAVGEQIDDASKELVGILTSIELIQNEIADKTAQIADTEEKYETAKSNEETLYGEMKMRVRFLYEQGETTYVTLLLQSKDFSDFLNKASYVEELYDYDRQKLAEFVAAKEAAAELAELLEEERSELETSEYEMEEEQAYMEELIAQYREQYADFDVKLTRAKQEAAVYSTQLKAQTAQLRSLQNEIDQKQKDIKTVAKAASEAASREAAEKKAKEEAERKAREKQKKKEEEAKAKASAGDNGDSPTEVEPVVVATTVSIDEGSSSSDTGSGGGGRSYSAPGAATGSNIASYACQFVGNPYVAGGTSLTNGCDCSGFVMAVYKDFGISVPRTSYSQSQYGREVSYDNAQAGDVIYYGGHVAIYLGGGRIVHASTPKTGIKYESATYRTILTIRRFL